jgi:hypothetical protein
MYKEVERYEITKSLWHCKMVEGISESEHVITMVGYTERSRSLGFPHHEALVVEFYLLHFTVLP